MAMAGGAYMTSKNKQGESVVQCLQTCLSKFTAGRLTLQSKPACVLFGESPKGRELVLSTRLILQGRLIAPFFVCRFCSCSGLFEQIPGLFCVRRVLIFFIERKL